MCVNLIDLEREDVALFIIDVYSLKRLACVTAGPSVFSGLGPIPEALIVSVTMLMDVGRCATAATTTPHKWMALVTIMAHR